MYLFLFSDKLFVLPTFKTYNMSDDEVVVEKRARGRAPSKTVDVSSIDIVTILWCCMRTIVSNIILLCIFSQSIKM